MTTCVDLEEKFGRRYKVSLDESYYAQYGPSGRTHDPWFIQIPCKHGAIYPCGGEMLGASTNGRGAIANRLAALPCVRVVQDGADGINANFHVDDFEIVAALVKPKQRRRLTPEQIAVRNVRLMNHRFVSASQSDFGDIRRDPRSRTDPNPRNKPKAIPSPQKTTK